MSFSSATALGLKVILKQPDFGICTWNNFTSYSFLNLVVLYWLVSTGEFLASFIENAHTLVGLIKIINAKRPNIHIIFLVIFIVRCFMFCNLSFFFRFVYFLIGSSFSRTSFRENLFYFLIIFPFIFLYVSTCKKVHGF